MSFIANNTFIGKWATVSKSGQVVDNVITEEDPLKKRSYSKQYKRTNYTRTDVRTLTSNNCHPKDLEKWDLQPPSEYWSERLLSASISYDIEGIARCIKVYGSTDKKWVQVGDPIVTIPGGDLTEDGQ